MGDLRSFGMDDQSDESVLFIYRKTRELQPISVRRCFAIANKELQINEEIRDKEVRVIGAEGEQMGIMSSPAIRRFSSSWFKICFPRGDSSLLTASSRDAYNMAQEKNLDLVKIAPQPQPPVCRIMDYGKYRFEQAKREKESRKNQKTIEVKETRLSLNIDTHDFDTKVNQTKKFLSSGNRVKVSIRFRGREMAHSQLGYGIMQRFAEACADVGNVEKPAKLEGRSMIMFMNAKPAPTNKQQ